MKVSELVNALSKCDAESEVYFAHPDDLMMQHADEVKIVDNVVIITCSVEIPAKKKIKIVVDRSFKL